MFWTILALGGMVSLAGLALFVSIYWRRFFFVNVPAVAAVPARTGRPAVAAVPAQPRHLKLFGLMLMALVVACIGIALARWGWPFGGGPETVKTTVETVTYSPGWNTRHALKRDTASQQAESRAEVLRRMAADPRKSVRESVIADASSMREPKTFPVVVNLLTDKEVGAQAAEALVKLGKAEDDKKVADGAIDALASALERGPNNLREKASACLVKIGAGGASRVIAGLCTENEDALWYTEKTLFELPSDAKEAIERGIDDCQNENVSVRAKMVLGWREAGKIPEDIMKSSPECREAAEKAKKAEEAEEAAKEKAKAAEEAQKQAKAQRDKDEAELKAVLANLAEIKKILGDLAGLNGRIAALAEIIRQGGPDGAPKLMEEMEARKRSLLTRLCQLVRQTDLTNDHQLNLLVQQYLQNQQTAASEFRHRTPPGPYSSRIVTQVTVWEK